MSPKDFAARPLLLVFAALCSGLALAVSPWFALLAAAALALAREWPARLFIALAFVGGLLLRPDMRPAAAPEPGLFRGEVTVASVPKGAGALREMQVMREGRLFIVEVDVAQGLSLGDKVFLSALVVPGGANTRARGISGRMVAVQDVRRMSQGFFLWRWGLAARESFQRAAEASMTPRTAALVNGLCFGDTSGIQPEDRKAIIDSGAAHLMAVSGANIVLLVGLAGAVCFRLPIPRWAQAGVVAAILAAYAAASGLNMAVIRALIMGCVVIAAPLSRRQPDSLSAMALAGIAGLLVQPKEIVGAGFWLSFAAAAALISFSPSEASDRWQESVRAWLAAQARSHAAATLATLPIVALFFGRLPLLGILTTLGASWLCLGLMAASLVCWLVWLVLPPVGGAALGWIIEPLAAGLLAIFHWFGQPWAALDCAPPPWWLMLLWYASALSFAIPRLRTQPEPLKASTKAQTTARA